jgi:hypothetical protein
MKVWVLTGRTESGDPIGPHVWPYDPPQAKIDALLKDTYDEEWEYMDGQLNYRVEGVEVEP